MSHWPFKAAPDDLGEGSVDPPLRHGLDALGDVRTDRGGQQTQDDRRGHVLGIVDGDRFCSLGVVVADTAGARMGLDRLRRLREDRQPQPRGRDLTRDSKDPSPTHPVREQPVGLTGVDIHAQLADDEDSFNEVRSVRSPSQCRSQVLGEQRRGRPSRVDELYGVGIVSNFRPRAQPRKYVSNHEYTGLLVLLPRPPIDRPPPGSSRPGEDEHPLPRTSITHGTCRPRARAGPVPMPAPAWSRSLHCPTAGPQR